MFLQIIFRRLGLKENKYILALVYALIYMVGVFIILVLSGLYLGRLDMLRYLRFSLFIGIVMYIIYLIKWAVMKSI